ncbi:MAG: DUF6020 family protein [Eubacteriales bacterium]|nr:DUF6020 family protein [Eubacteriales bacterium]
MKRVGQAAMIALAMAGLALYSPFAAELTWGSALARALGGGALAGVALWRARPQKRAIRYAFGTGAAFALSCVLGMELQNHGVIRPDASALALNLLCFVGLGCLWGLLGLWLLTRGGAAIRRLSRWEERRALEPAGFPKKLFFTAWLGVFLCWLPVWLAFFPVLGNYDIASHVQQCVSGAYSTLHPLLYTLLIKAFMELGGENHTLAMALLAAFQLLLMSGSFACAAARARQLGARLFAVLGVLAFCALFPVFPILSLSVTKDAPYACFALLTMTELARLFALPADEKKRAVAPFLLCAALTGLLRYNGVVALGLMTLGALALWRGAAWKERLGFAALSIAAAALVAVGTAGLNGATRAESSFVTRRDLASLPSQQLIRSALETEDYDEYLRIMQWYGGETALTRYRPRLADYTKLYIKVDHDDGWRGYYRTWLQVGLRHPKAYLEAFLELNRGLWFVDDLSHTEIYVTGLEHFGYLTNNEVDCAQEGYLISYDSKLPGLKALLNRLTADNGYLAIPGVRWLFSVGFQCWLALALGVIGLYRRDRVLSRAMSWSVAQLIVLLAAPAVLVRYELPIFCGNALGLMLATRRVQPRPKINS